MLSTTALRYTCHAETSGTFGGPDGTIDPDQGAMPFCISRPKQASRPIVVNGNFDHGSRSRRTPNGQHPRNIFRACLRAAARDVQPCQQADGGGIRGHGCRWLNPVCIGDPERNRSGPAGARCQADPDREAPLCVRPLSVRQGPRDGTVLTQSAFIRRGGAYERPPLPPEYIWSSRFFNKSRG